MLYFKDVPVVIEPGVAALEVGIISSVKKQNRLLFVPFERVVVTAETAEFLPFIVSSSAPHVFALHSDLETTPFLLVYDYLGKLNAIYERDKGRRRAWLRHDAAPEQVGDTVTQFSVRLSFADQISRDKFLNALGRLTDRYKTQDRISKADAAELIQLVTASRVGPVVLPIAVAKAKSVSV